MRPLQTKHEINEENWYNGTLNASTMILAESENTTDMYNDHPNHIHTQDLDYTGPAQSSPDRNSLKLSSAKKSQESLLSK